MDVTELPLPPDPQDGPRIQNDIVGAVLWGPPTQPTLSLGRSDIWDRRWFGGRQPLITLAKIRELAMEDRLSEIMRHANDSVYDVYQRYDFPCPKPGAQLVMGLPFARGVRVRKLDDSAIQMTVDGEEHTLDARIWVSLSRSLVVASLETGGSRLDDWWVRVYRHHDTILPGMPVDSTIGGKGSASDFEPLPAPCAFHRGASFGVIQDFPGEMTFPDGFSVAIASTILGTECEVECRNDEHGLGTPLWAEKEGRLTHGLVKRYTPINEAPGSAATATPTGSADSFTVVTAIATTQDDADVLDQACQMLEDARSLGVRGLLQERQETTDRMERKPRARVRVTGGSDPANIYGLAFTEKTQDGETTELAAASGVYPRLRRPDGYYSDVPPCTVGNTKFWFQDAGLWHNDFHLNEVRAEPMLTLGLFPEILPYCEMIHNLLPMAEENAREVYRLPGAMYPLVHFPLRWQGVVHANPTWELDLGLNGLASKPLWLYYRYTGDEEFLRDLAYPVLRSCARFCRACLTEEADGCCHIFPTVSPEHWGLTPRFERNRDCLSALTLTRYLFRAAAEAAKTLRVDADEANDWASAAERLAPYPTYGTPAGPVWVDVDGAPPIEYNIPVPLAAVFWGDEVGLDSPPELLAMARRTLDQIRIWEPHSPYLNWCIRHRLGIWTEDAKIAPESFLLSYQSIRIFPNLPPEGEVVMEHFAAQGGFRVSAIRTEQGAIEDVEITSVLGWPCRVASPWPTRAVVCLDERGTEAARTNGNESHVAFETKPGKRYRLYPR